MSDWCPENDGAYRAELAEREKSSRKLTHLEQELLEAVKLVHGSFGGGLVITFSDDDVKWFTDLVAKAEGKSPNNQTDGVA